MSAVENPTRLPRTHCRRGHELTPDNIYIDPRGCRNCRECIRIRRQRVACVYCGDLAFRDGVCWAHTDLPDMDADWWQQGGQDARRQESFMRRLETAGHKQKMRDYWLERFSPDEIRELAAGLSGWLEEAAA